MHTNDKESLKNLLNQTKNIYQNISRQINWTAADAECLDNLMCSQEQKKDIYNRIAKVWELRALRDYMPSFLIYKAWYRTKAVYSFYQELVDDIAQTADTRLYISLIERLPFKDMLFFFPDSVLPTLDNEEVAGMFVHIEKHPEHLWIAVSSFNRIYQKSTQILPGMCYAFPITDGMYISHVFETPQYQEWLSSLNNANKQRMAEITAAGKRILSTVINLIYYLSSKNADIKEIKHRKKSRKTTAKEDNTPAINLHEVGVEYAEIVYRYLKENTVAVDNDDDDNNDDDNDNNEDAAVQIVKSRKKRRPHIRRAHYQHYWTGQGRTTLELRWKSDLFVGTNRDKQAIIVYDIARGPSLKGKRNPNTSKKKRNK